MLAVLCVNIVFSAVTSFQTTTCLFIFPLKMCSNRLSLKGSKVKTEYLFVNVKKEILASLFIYVDIFKVFCRACGSAHSPFPYSCIGHQSRNMNVPLSSLQKLKTFSHVKTMF